MCSLSIGPSSPTFHSGNVERKEREVKEREFGAVSSSSITSPDSDLLSPPASSSSPEPTESTEDIDLEKLLEEANSHIHERKKKKEIGDKLKRVIRNSEELAQRPAQIMTARRNIAFLRDLSSENFPKLRRQVLDLLLDIIESDPITKASYNGLRGLMREFLEEIKSHKVMDLGLDLQQKMIRVYAATFELHLRHYSAGNCNAVDKEFKDQFLEVVKQLREMNAQEDPELKCLVQLTREAVVRIRTDSTKIKTMFGAIKNVGEIITAFKDRSIDGLLAAGAEIYVKVDNEMKKKWFAFLLVVNEVARKVLSGRPEEQERKMIRLLAMIHGKKDAFSWKFVARSAEIIAWVAMKSTNPAITTIALEGYSVEKKEESTGCGPLGNKKKEEYLWGLKQYSDPLKVGKDKKKLKACYVAIKAFANLLTVENKKVQAKAILYGLKTNDGNKEAKDYIGGYLDAAENSSSENENDDDFVSMGPEPTSPSQGPSADNSGAVLLALHLPEEYRARVSRLLEGGGLALKEGKIVISSMAAVQHLAEIMKHLPVHKFYHNEFSFSNEDLEIRFFEAMGERGALEYSYTGTVSHHAVMFLAKAIREAPQHLKITIGKFNELQNDDARILASAYGEARSEKKFIDLQISDDTSLNLFALAFKKVGHPKLAMQFFQTYTQNNGSNYKPYLNLAEMMLENLEDKEQKETQKLLSRASDLKIVDKHDLGLLYQLYGRMYKIQGNMQNCKINLQKAYECEPESPKNSFYLATFYRSLWEAKKDEEANRKEAIKLFKQAIRQAHDRIADQSFQNKKGYEALINIVNGHLEYLGANEEKK